MQHKVSPQLQSSEKPVRVFQLLTHIFMFIPTFFNINYCLSVKTAGKYIRDIPRYVTDILHFAYLSILMISFWDWPYQTWSHSFSWFLHNRMWSLPPQAWSIPHALIASIAHFHAFMHTSHVLHAHDQHELAAAIFKFSILLLAELLCLTLVLLLSTHHLSSFNCCSIIIVINSQFRHELSHIPINDPSWQRKNKNASFSSLSCTFQLF